MTDTTTCPACGNPLPPWGSPARVRENTCSDTCHRAWVDRLVARYGETKEITNLETGTTHLVPTRLILEQGLKGVDLSRFPEKARP